MEEAMNVSEEFLELSRKTRDQLDEVSIDYVRGEITPAEAKANRAEIWRSYLEATAREVVRMLICRAIAKAIPMPKGASA